MNSTITFALKSVGNFTVPLTAEVWLNDEIKFNDEVHDVEIPICIEVDDSVEKEHLLSIVLKNKKPEHTTVDENGEIMSDVRLIVKDISIDDINLGHLITKVAEYHHDFNGTNSPTTEKFYGEMGCNGTVKLKFSTPVYLWLLENM